MRLIDAVVLLKHLTNCIETTKGLFRSVCVAIKCFVEQMPAVDAVPVVHGRWLTAEEYANQGNNGWLYCSVCEQPMREFYGWGYCPNCGATMDK